MGVYKKPDGVKRIKVGAYKKPSWAIQQIVRISGLVEDICEHGVGHPNRQWMEENDPDGEKGFGIHDCDGCCHKEG